MAPISDDLAHEICSSPSMYEDDVSGIQREVDFSNFPKTVSWKFRLLQQQMLPLPEMTEMGNIHLPLTKTR